MDTNGPMEKEKKKGEDEARTAENTPFLKLFGFADSFDYLLMIIGGTGACIHGASLPVFLFFFGKLINTIGIAYLSPKLVSHEVGQYSLDFVYLGAVTLFSAWAEVACWMYTGERQAAKMRLASYLRSVLNQDISLFDAEGSTAEVTVAITSDIIVVQDAISEKVGKFIHYISRFIAGFTIGFARVWQLSLVALSIFPLIAIVIGIHAYIATGHIVRVRKTNVKAGEIVEEVIGNIRTVQAFVGEEKAVKLYKDSLFKTYEYGKKAGLAKGLGLGSVHFVLFCSWALLVWYASIVVHKNIANGGESFTTMFNVVISGLSLGMAAPVASTIIRARAAAHPMFEMIEKNRVNKTNSRNGRTLVKVEGHVEFKDVCFNYPSRPDVQIFNKLCLNIPSGKSVALVGGSGSGKSTLISLIERFYEPLSGNILLDGNDVRQLELKWLRQQIGLVSQEPALFATSIHENILYGKDDASIEEVSRAAKLSEAISFINNLPDKYETQVGERGVQLSGGQKQRIAISRAILKNPSILLLDEATSALDVDSEKIVQQTLDRIMVGRTTIVVAHRLSTIRHADIIAVVQGGIIVETGSHDKLMLNTRGVYASLVHVQESTILQQHPSQGPSTGRQSSIRHSQTMSRTESSFRSDKDSQKEYGGDEETETVKPKTVSMRKLYRMAGPDMIYGLFGAIGAIVAGAQMPLFALGITQALVSYYMDWETTQQEIRKIAMLFLGGAVITVLFHTLEHLSFAIMGERLTLRIREKMFTGMLSNEIGWFDEPGNNSSMLSTRLEADATLVKTVVVDGSIILLQGLSLAMTAFIVAFILNWRITLVVIATYPLLISSHIGENLFIKGYGGNLSKAYLKANMHAAEAIRNIRTVAAFCSEGKVIAMYSQDLEAPSKDSFRRGQIAGISFGVSQFFMFSAYGLALWYGSILMEKELAGFKSIMKSFVVLIVTALSMAETLALGPELVKGNQMLTSVFEILDRNTKVVSDVGEELTRVEGSIELKGIEFSYPSRPDVVIFKDFNLKVHSGKTMALVGSSGSGKSSVIALVLRFYDVKVGKVMVDGINIRKLKLKSIRKHIGFVQQEPTLFATSIYENILYGRDEASETEVIEAAKLANAHTFISSLPEGYSTKVGDRGVQLSGGQKQRVAIARAVLASA